MNVVPVGGDDNHSEREIGKAWTMIKAPELTYDALIKAYKNGDSYASSGAEIKELYVEDGKACIRVSPNSTIHFKSEGRFIATVYNKDYAEFELNEARLGRYFYFEVKDANGNLAFTRAYRFDELK